MDATASDFPAGSFFTNFWMKKEGTATAKKLSGMVTDHAIAAQSASVQRLSMTTSSTADIGWISGLSAGGGG